MRENRYFISDSSWNPIPALNMETWARWFGANDGDARRLAETRTKLFWVSTVFLGINHNWNPNGPPLIFETMAFRQPRAHDIRAVMPESPLMNYDELCDRYSTSDHAFAGHIAIVAECLALEAQHSPASLDRILRRKAPSARRHKIQLKRAA